MNPYIPKFASGEKEASGSDRGSAYHRVLELLDYEGLAGMLNGDVKAWYEAQLQSLIDAGRITKEEVDLVNPKKICTFLQSPVAARMAQAAVRGDLYKEQPFVLAVSAKDLSEEFPEEEKVLIQGIIDVYFIEDNEIVLLDYKTDAVNSGEELVQRYKTQLDYYRKALENIYGRKVKERLLYAFRLEETVEVK